MQKYASAKGPSWTITDNGGADLFDEAMECMLEACRFDGDDTRYQSAASHILMSKYYRDGYADTDTIKEAIRHGQRSVELGDNNHSTYYSLGHACMQLGDEEAAIKYFEHLWALHVRYTLLAFETFYL